MTRVQSSLFHPYLALLVVFKSCWIFELILSSFPWRLHHQSGETVIYSQMNTLDCGMQSDIIKTLASVNFLYIPWLICQAYRTGYIFFDNPLIVLLPLPIFLLPSRITESPTYYLGLSCVPCLLAEPHDIVQPTKCWWPAKK